MEKCGPIQDFCVRGSQFRIRSSSIGREFTSSATFMAGRICSTAWWSTLSRDLDANPISDCMTVTLGDYIDRGPDSRGVLDRLVRNTFPTDLIALKGNHEALLQMFLDDPAVAEHWRRLGGLETLHSYGVPAACWGAVRHGRSRDYQLGRSKDAGSFFGNRRKLVDLM